MKTNLVRAGSACPLSTAFLALAITLTLTACGKGGGDVKLLEGFPDDNGELQTKIEYDDKNRIVKIYGYSGEGKERNVSSITTIIYNGDDSVTVVEDRVGYIYRIADTSGTASVDTTKYVKNGNTITIQSKEKPITLTINEGGYIVKEVAGVSFTYQYKDSNLTDIECFGYTDVDEDGHQYRPCGEDYREFDNKKSPFSNTNTPKWLLQNLFNYVYANKNNVLTHASGEEGNEGIMASLKYTYEYDSDGFPTKQIREKSGEGVGNETRITLFAYCAKTKCTAINAEEAAASLAAARQAAKKRILADQAEREAKIAAKYAMLAEAVKYAKAEKEKAIKEGRTFTDERDGKIYMLVKIGEQTWMAENLNYKTKDSQCYGEGGKERAGYGAGGYEAIYKTFSKSEIQDNCDKYGRFYNWKAAIKACPSGWHLPSKEEWQALVNFAGGEEVAGKKLKAKNGWVAKGSGDSGNGTDDYGFSAFPGGLRYSDEPFSSIGEDGYWWAATEYNDYAERLRMANYMDDTSITTFEKSRLHSVRCIKDEDKTSVPETDQTTVNNEAAQ